jgi:alpha-glucan, water dikinase
MHQEQATTRIPEDVVPSDERITLKSGAELRVETALSEGKVEVHLRLKNAQRCFLHWGLSRSLSGPWQSAPESAWPRDTTAAGQRAVQTPFGQADGEGRIVIKLDPVPEYRFIAFVLFYPEQNRWDNNQGRDYHIRLPGREPPSMLPAEALKGETSGHEVLYESLYDLDHEGSLAAAVFRDRGEYRLTLVTSLPVPLLLHWGVARKNRREWALPPAGIRPPGTVVFDELAVQTPFVSVEGGLGLVRLEMPPQDLPMGVCFVLREVDTGRWLKDRGHDFYVPVDDPSYRELDPGDPQLSALAAPIVSAETSRNSWTLMHRFDLCHDLLDRVGGNVDGLALLFVWLRYSAIRQLDWQRNYNTKPRELSHSLDRLTQKLAETYVRQPAGRDLVRLMFTSAGRGGEGQRIRDEILEIMHRYRVKEVSGHFLEEWHQKLHNNTTPDDIVICQAYLEFLRRYGDLDAFYRTLRQGGVSRERLENYERPIRSAPDFVPRLREGLMRDFEHFLGTLRAVHSGVDLEAAVKSSRGLLDAACDQLLRFVTKHREDRSLPAAGLAEKIAEVRGRIKGRLDKGRQIRELLFLDLALESTLRTTLERSLGAYGGTEDRVGLIRWALENFVLCHEDPEIEACLRHWRVLGRESRFEGDWVLQAAALVERLTRGLAEFERRLRDLLQPKAEFLGQAFGADSWATEVFSEEVVRGTLASVLSTLLHHLQARLREAADLGDWQVVSPGHGAGRIEVVDALESVQGMRFDRPVVVLADRLSGYEEIPEGVTAILTPRGVDALSHLAIRARNRRLLFASCYNRETIEQLRSMQGSGVRVSVNGSGQVTIQEGEGEPVEADRPRQPAPSKAFTPRFIGYAVPLEAFEEETVGRKSLNLRRLAGRLPPWISVPRSVAVPFGVFDRVRMAGPNRAISREFDRLAERVGDDPECALKQLKQAVLSLEAPEVLMQALFEVMERAGLPHPGDAGQVWTCVKRVWASKWNRRACLSRKARGIDHGDLHMAVLIQEVVDAEYGFVIHTTNPLSGDREELYAEAVLGLGESLVSNQPGSALRFVCRKETSEPRILAYPSKSLGLYGKGLIFRSDSSGEDLAGYAGAGLYDSYMLEPPARVRLDYAEEPLVRDKSFQRQFAVGLARIGLAVEAVFLAPQDIEGACSRGRYWVVQSRPQVGLGDG